MYVLYMYMLIIFVVTYTYMLVWRSINYSSFAVVFMVPTIFTCVKCQGVGEKSYFMKVVKKYSYFMHCTCLSTGFSDFNLPRIYEEQYFAVWIVYGLA